MTDEEFLEKYPVSVFHGTADDKGSVCARLFNPRVHDGIYRVGEAHLFRCIKRSQEHQRICPQDKWNVAQQAVAREALDAVQTRKIELGIMLEAPRLDEKPKLKLISGGSHPELACEM